MNKVGKFEYCSIFDNGAGLLSDTTMDYPLMMNIDEAMGNVRAKTICPSFEEQLEISEALYGVNLRFNFSKGDVKEIINQVDIYSREEKQRVESIIFYQMRKYQYLFTA